MAEPNKRIYELAREYKISSNAMLTILNNLRFQPKSHMSVATAEMVAAVKLKFTEEKREAKKEMDHRAHVKEATARSAITAKGLTTSTTQVGDVKVSNPASPVAQEIRRIDRKQKRKDRRKKRGRQSVDRIEVVKSFKATMANLSGGKPKRRYRRGGENDDGVAELNENLLEVTEYMSLSELAQAMDRKPAELIAKLFELGMMATINQRLDIDTIGMVAEEFGFGITEVAEVGEESIEAEQEDHLTTRAPIVTVMGHVDHGKTSLLDFIRETNVTAGEAGAITQHIGAYVVHHDKGAITFLDTPGHEAFTAMRARGSQITDIVVLVVAADDGVQPQTVEAIDHARAAGAPIIVAINKIDKPSANMDQVRTQLASHNLSPEDWGGKTIMVPVSAKNGEGVERLLEMILLQAEMMDLQADSTIRATGVVVDSRLEKGRGPVVTVLVQKGTCSVGNPIVSGVSYGRARTLTDDRNRSLERVGPSTPVQVTGLSGVPQAGDSFTVMRSDQEAKEISTKRSQIKREHDFRRTHGHTTLEKVFERIQEGQIKEVRLIIKGDVDGSVEVLCDTLGKIATDEVKTNIIHRAVGGINESDVLLAAASDAIILGFQVSIDSRARSVAKAEKVDIRQYDVIYEAEKDVKLALEGLLAPTVSERFVGQAEVRNLFKVPKVGTIAGSYIKEGRLARNDRVKLVRDGKVVYTGQLSSLRRFKDDAREVKEGFECGIGIENYQDIKVGDIIDAFEIVETARTL